MGFNKAAVLAYRLELESCHLRRRPSICGWPLCDGWPTKLLDTGLMSPESAASIRWVKGARQLGVRLGNWLTADEAKAVLDAADIGTVQGKRSRAILALCLSCGLRRSELAHLTMEHLQKRENYWAIVDLIGKGGHVRTIPVPEWAKAAVDDGTAAAGVSSGQIFRCVNKSGSVWGTGITQKVVWAVVKECAAKSGIAELAPHDLRRTCAKLCHVAGGELEQIQFLLGHVSIQTTEHSLGCRQRPKNAVNDRIGIEPEDLRPCG